MYPFIKPGDRLVIRNTQTADVQVGDILAFHVDQLLTVHRVIKILPEEQFMTKGDAMPMPDRLPIPADAMAGKVAIILRGRRLIAVTKGFRERFKRWYVWLSARNLTWGSLKGAIKQKQQKGRGGRANVFPGVDGRLKYQRWLRETICETPHTGTGCDRNTTLLEATAVREGVAGYLYPLLKKRGAPEKTVAVFKRHYLTIAARNLTGQAAIARLEKDLQKRQITIMVLKGASLSDSIYSRPGLRMMEDVDILVRPADRSRFIAMLNRHGFRADPGRSHCFITGQTVVDLHTDALNVERVASRKWLFPNGMQPIWDRSLPWQEDCRQIRRPADIDNVLLLTQHALKHACARLIWLVDLWLLLRGRPLQFWEALHDRAVQLHQLKALYQVLFLLAREFELVVPGPFEKPAGQISWLNRQLLLLREDGRTDAYTGILLPLFSISGFKRRVVFAWESVFLSRTTAQKEFASSFTSRPAVYYLNRLGLSAVQALNFIHRLGISLLTRREL